MTLRRTVRGDSSCDFPAACRRSKEYSTIAMRYSTKHALIHVLLILVSPRMAVPRQSVYFTMDSYTTTIPANFPEREPLGRVYTRTFPINCSASLVLDIVAMHKVLDGAQQDPVRSSERKSQELFEIEQTSGRIYLQQPVGSRENITGWNFTLQISAWTQRERSRVVGTEPPALAEFRVAITETLPPCSCFDQQTHRVFRLKSDAQNGAFGTLRPYPRCSSASGASWKYSLLSENNTEWLHIDNRTAELTLARHPTMPLQSTNLTVECSVETGTVMETTATLTNQTRSELAFVELLVEPVPDCTAVIQYNRSKGDHVTWVKTSNPKVRKWHGINVILAGKHSDFYSFVTTIEKSPMVTPAHQNEKVIGELVLQRPLPWCFEDKHTLILQLRDDARSQGQVVNLVVQVEIHALSNWTASVLDLTLHRNASLYTRVAVVEAPSCAHSKSDIMESTMELIPDNGLLQLESTSMIVFINDEAPLQNTKLTFYTATVRQQSTQEGRQTLMEWKLQITIVGQRDRHENASSHESTCSHHFTREACERDCGLGAPNGRCKWRQQVDPMKITTNYSTCSPDFSTCPNRICDTLEQQQKKLCPQDCVVMQTVNIEAFMTMNANKVGIDKGVGPCSCEENGLRCMCKRSTMKKATVIQATQPTTAVGKEPYSIQMLAKPSQQVSPTYTFSCPFCVFLIPVIVGSVIAVVLVLVFFSRGRRLPLCRRSCGQHYKPPVIVDSSDSRLSTVLSECSDDGLHLSKFSVTRLKTEFDPKWEFPRRNLVLDKVLGEGQFGRVVRAQALSLRGHTGYTTVAVKMLKGSYSSDDLQDLITEMNLLKDFNHHNVLKLLGASTQKGPLYVIVEYCHHGCLRDFLRSNRQGSSSQDDRRFLKDYDQIHCADGKTCIAWCNRNLLSFAWQICKGMQYVAMLKLVHRDLAARNILVSQDMVMKVSDFGLARDLYETGTYVKNSKSRIPMKWMAPESLFDNIYTTKTDIWSFGVLFWEIVTMGAMPYPGISCSKLCQLLRQGHRLERPEGCADELYAVMQLCWHNDPNDRPDFDMLGSMLEQIILKDSDYLDLSCSPFGDCSDSEDLTNRPEDEQTSSAIPLLHIPSCERTEGSPCTLSFTKDHRINSSEFNLKKIITEETSLESGPLYGDMDPCRLYSNVNNNFISDHTNKTASEPNLTVSSIFQ